MYINIKKYMVCVLIMCHAKYLTLAQMFYFSYEKTIAKLSLESVS